MPTSIFNPLASVIEKDGEYVILDEKEYRERLMKEFIEKVESMKEEMHRREIETEDPMEGSTETFVADTQMIDQK